MKKPNKANIFAKECMVYALMQLLEDKQLSEISIVEIVEKAGVSRMTYYRNYKFKEDIFISYLDDVIAMYTEEIEGDGKNTLSNYQVLLKCFNYFAKFKDFTKCLIKANLTHILLDGLNNFIVTKAKRINYKKSYAILYAYIGALFNIYLQWINDESIGTLEELSSMISKILR